MRSQIFQIIDQIAREKGVEREAMFSAIESAVEYVARKKYPENTVIKVRFNSKDEHFELFALKKAVTEVTDKETEILLDDAHSISPECNEGDTVEIKLETIDLGRIGVQTVKQVISQKLKDVERDQAYSEFLKLKGDIITGTVDRIEKGNLIVDLIKADGIIFYRDQIPKEKFRKGDRITAYVAEVNKSTKGLQIILSRTSSELLIKLFKSQVPEIEDDIVIIEGASRDPGWRGKIAVRSLEKDVDPVGACVGVRGSRVQAVVRELSGERVDIVRWSAEPKEFIKNAIMPAQIISVKVDKLSKKATVIVEDDQLYLAIGKKGQNVKLASMLTGYHIDIFSRTEAESGKDASISKHMAVEQLSSIPGINTELVEALVEKGYKNVRAVSDADAAELALIHSIGIEKATHLIESAMRMLKNGES